jgi:uncharacterized alpha-E superfamily protein
MLSRTADHLYWMSRYTERAENLARMLDVNCRMTLLRQEEDVVRRRWMSTLATVGQLEPFLAAHGVVTQASAIDWISFEHSNPGSIDQCLDRARDNAHAVRGTLTSETWETLNATWLEIGRFRRDTVSSQASGAGRFLRVGEVPLASGARRDPGHDAAGRRARVHAARYLP